MLKGAAITNVTIFIIMCVTCAPGQLLLIHNVPDAVGVLLASVAHNKHLLLAMLLALAVLAVVPQISLLLLN